MGGIFDYDGFLMQFLNKITNCVFLSLLWLVFSLPLITIGASTTALYYTVNKVIRNDRSHVWQEFWSSFKSNFKQSTLSWILLVVLYVLWAVDFYYTYALYLTGVVPKAVLIVFLVFVVLLTMWGLYLFPYIARFTNSIKEILVSSGMMFIQNILWSVVLLVIFLLTVVIFLSVPMLIVILPVGYMMLQNFILERIFKKYMSAEDLEAEEQRNNKYKDEV